MFWTFDTDSIPTDERSYEKLHKQ